MAWTPPFKAAWGASLWGAVVGRRVDLRLIKEAEARRGRCPGQYLRKLTRREWEAVLRTTPGDLTPVHCRP